MLRFYAMSFAACIGAMERAAGIIATSELIGAQTYSEIGRQKMREALRDLGEACKELPVSYGLQEQIARIQKRVDKDSDEALLALVRELHNSVMTDLATNYYLVIQTGQLREMYEQQSPPFGELVETQFPDSSRDIAAAARCFALDEWTASVFHLMRVLEHGLRKAAERFSVPFVGDSWHKVIKGIEDGVNILRNKKGLTDQDKNDITKYSDMAVEFRHFKDAWRNHVSHARVTYDQKEARQIWNHVQSFMQKIAADA